MNIYPEIKKIAGANAKVNRLAKILAEKIDVDGCCFQSAYIVNGCKEKDGHLYWKGEQLDNCKGPVDDDYYCCQYNGYCEDCYHGTLYFKTNVPGQFVAVPFEI